MDGIIENYCKKIITSDNKMEVYKQLLNQFKHIAIECFNGKSFCSEYTDYISRLVSISDHVPCNYITDTNVELVKSSELSPSKLFKGRDFLVSNIEDVLDFLVYNARMSLIHYQNNDRINQIDLTNKCYDAASHLEVLGKSFNLAIKFYMIKPGFDKHEELLEGSGYHCFNVLEFDSNYYLIDVTYKQFFLEKKCLLESLGVPHLFPPCAGVFMMMDGRTDTAKTLLKRGWILLDEKSFKDYMDGFLLSYRNGLYYEVYGRDFSAGYSVEDYENFLLGKDSQTKHEDIKYLGYQNRPLKNPNMII